MPARVVAGLRLGSGAAAAVFVDGRLAAAVRQEIIDRCAGSAAFPSGALDAALDVAGVRPADVAAIGIAGLPAARLGMRARFRELFTRALPAGGVAGSSRVRAASSVADDVRTEAEVRARLAAARLPAVACTLVSPSEVASAVAHLVRGVGDAGVIEALRSPSGEALAAAAFVLTTPALTASIPAGAARWGASLPDGACYRALSNAKLPRLPADDPAATAESFLSQGVAVAWARGPLPFLDTDVEPRGWLRSIDGKRVATALLGPDGVLAATPTDVIRAWRSVPGAALILGGYVVPPQ